MDINLSIMPYGQKWRRHKRAFWQYFHPGTMTGYQGVQRAVAHKFLAKLLRDPAGLKDHIR